MTKLPLKVRILEYAIEKDAPFTIDELVEKLGRSIKARGLPLSLYGKTRTSQYRSQYHGGQQGVV